MKKCARCSFLIFLFLVLLLSGCRPDLPQAVKPVGGARFVRFTPTTTLTPSPTLTPTEVIIALPGTPFPTPQAALNVDNAVDMEEIAAWGRGKPQAISWSADGRTLAVATSRGIYLFDSQTLDIKDSVGASTLYRSLSFSPDGEYLAAGSDDGLVRLWQTDDYSLLATLDGHDAAVLNLAFSSSGDLLASGSWDNSICVWQVAAEIDPDEGPRYALDIAPANGVQALAFSEDESEIFTWSPPAEVLVVDLSTAETRTIYTGRILDNASPTMEFSPGSQVIAIENDELIQLYQGSNGYTLYKLSGFQEDIETMTFSADGELLATAGKSHVDIWQVERGTLLQSYDMEETRPFVRSMAFSNDSTRLALLGDRVRVIELSETAEKVAVGDVQFSGQNLAFLQFSDGGQNLAAGWNDSSLSTYRVPDGSNQAHILLQEEHDNLVSGFAISPDGMHALTAYWDGHAQLWRVSGSAGSIEGELEVEDSITCVAFSGDGSLLAAGTRSGEVLFWQTEDLELLAAIELDELPQDIRLSQDGQFMAVRTVEGIGLWHLNGTRSSLQPQHIVSVDGSQAAFSPTGELLAVAVDFNGLRHIRIYRCEDGSPAAVIDSGGEGVLAFSPDGSLLALSGYDLSLWSVPEGEQLVRLDSRAPYGQLTFSSDGKLLALAAGDGAIQLFGVP